MARNQGNFNAKLSDLNELQTYGNEQQKKIKSAFPVTIKLFVLNMSLKNHNYPFLKL